MASSDKRLGGERITAGGAGGESVFGCDRREEDLGFGAGDLSVREADLAAELSIASLPAEPGCLGCLSRNSVESRVPSEDATLARRFELGGPKDQVGAVSMPAGVVVVVVVEAAGMNRVTLEAEGGRGGSVAGGLSFSNPCSLFRTSDSFLRRSRIVRAFLVA